MNKKSIILVISLFVVLLIIYFILSSIKPKEQVIKLEKLTDEVRFVELDGAINSFLNNLDSIEENDILEYLNPKYITDNNIDRYNVLDILSTYNNPTFVSKSIQYKNIKNTYYYFVNGYVIDYNMEDNLDYYDNINYLLIVSGNTYNIYPLNNNNFNDFDISNINIKQGVFLDKTTYDRNSKLLSYINNFITLFSVSPTDAYNYLTEVEKNKYISTDDFYNRLSLKIENLSIDINQVIEDSNSDNKKYTVIDSNLNRIIIVEKSIMDYKIEFD